MACGVLDDVLDGDVVWAGVVVADDEAAVEATEACDGSADEGSDAGGGGTCDDGEAERTGLRRCSGIGPV